MDQDCATYAGCMTSAIEHTARKMLRSQSGLRSHRVGQLADRPPVERPFDNGLHSRDECLAREALGAAGDLLRRRMDGVGSAQSVEDGVLAMIVEEGAIEPVFDRLERAS